MTNRKRLQRALRDLERVAQDESISPTPYEHLLTAATEARKAGQFVLDVNERDGMKT